MVRRTEAIPCLAANHPANWCIVDYAKEMYDADISTALVSKVIERVIGQDHEEWQKSTLYPHQTLGCNNEGPKELQGLWLVETAGAKF